MYMYVNEHGMNAYRKALLSRAPQDPLPNLFFFFSSRSPPDSMDVKLRRRSVTREIMRT